MLLPIVAAGCQQTPAAKAPDLSPGSRLEAAAEARGLVADPAKVGLAGSWASETDRLCVVPAGSTIRLGAGVDYGEGQSCAASGTVEHDGGTLKIRFGECRFEAAFDGERIAFPAAMPAACDRYCTGRASMASLTVERLGESVSEAVALRDADSRLLCPAT